MRMNTLKCMGITILVATFIFACGAKNEKTTNEPVKEEVKQEKTETGQKEEQVKAPTRKEFENALKELGIPVYEGAEFSKIQKNQYGEGFSAYYYLQDSTPENMEKVHGFYDETMSELFEGKESMTRVDNGNLIIILKNDQNYVSVNNVKALKSNRHLLQFMLYEF